MIRRVLAVAFVLCLATGTAFPLATAHAAGTVGDYHSYRTDRPREGFVGYGTWNSYCSYIKYPIKDCRPHRVCKRGKCRTRSSCRILRWEIRQTCY